MPTPCGSTRSADAGRSSTVIRTSNRAPEPAALPEHRGSRGFTLIEILVAISILATALVGLLSLHGRNIQVVAYDQQLARATFLARQVLTRTLVQFPFPEPMEESGSFEEDPRFQWHVRITPGPTEDLEEELREVQVRVFWNVADPDAVLLITHVRKPDA